MNKSSHPLPVRAAQALLEYLGSLPPLAGVNLRRDDDPRTRPFPVLVVKVSNLRQEWADADEHSGLLNVSYLSGRDADANADSVSGQDADLVANQTAHQLIAVAIGEALNAQNAARGFCNFRVGTNRNVTDFHLYRLLENVESGEFYERAGGTAWQTDFSRVIVCARCDYAA